MAGPWAPAAFGAQKNLSKKVSFPSVVLCTVRYKISYCADWGSWPLAVYTLKNGVGCMCVSHEPVGNVAATFESSDCPEFCHLEIRAESSQQPEIKIK